MNHPDIPQATERRSGRRRIHGFSAQFPGADLTPEQTAFAQALDQYKREHRRPFPTCAEVLAVLHSLGYRRVADPAPEYERFVGRAVPPDLPERPLVQPPRRRRGRPCERDRPAAA